MNEEDNKDTGSSEQASDNKPESTSFWAELKRRKVMRVAITYAVVAWLLIQIAATVFPQLGMPEWAPRMVTLLLLIGFPIALIIAWAFELTPEGIKTTKSADEEREDAPVSKKQQRKRNWMTLGFAAGLPTLIFGILAGVFFIKARTAEAEIAASEQAEYDKSIAVLPLANMSPDAENAFFADGVHEDILTNLAKIRDLLVIGRTSTLEYRDTTKKLKDIGQELGVRYLVEGSVRRARNQVRITLQLIDTETENHLWAENYDRTLDDIFAIQSEIAQTVAGQLKAVISPEEIAQIQQLPTKSQEAYDLYIQQRLLWSTEGALLPVIDESISLLKRAVELDPEFAQAWSRLAINYYMDWHYLKSRIDSQLLNQGNQALAVAKRLAPDSAYAARAESFYFSLVMRNMNEANRLLLKALTIDPSYILSQTALAQNYRRLGQLEEAQFHFEAALRRDPLDEAFKRWNYRVYKERRLWDEALNEIRKNLETTPNDDFWKHQLVELKFLRYGDRRTLIEERSALSLFQDDRSRFRDFSQTLLSADYAEALQLLEGLDSDLSFGFLDRSISIKPRDLLSSLIWFARDELDQSRSNAERARAYWMEITENALSPSPTILSRLAISHALLGDENAVEAVIPEIRRLTAEPHYIYADRASCEMYIAICYVVLGDHEKAIETLEAASKMDGPIFLNRELDLWFIFDRLRGNPRFDALLEG